MAFPRKMLNQDERIILDLRPHWISLLVPTLWALLIIAVTVVLSILLVSFMPFVIGAGLLALLVFVVAKYWVWATTEFVLTSERVISRRGIFAKWAKDIPLNRINDVTFSQTVLERICGSGNLAIESAGEHGQNNFVFISHPERVQNEIYKAMEAHENEAVNRGQPPAVPAAPDIPTQIAKLAELKEKGILSEDEFEQKKDQLLARM